MTSPPADRASDGDPQPLSPDAIQPAGCEVCGERLLLAVRLDRDGQDRPHAWVHRNEDIHPRDHPAVPVDADTSPQVEQARCDFCMRSPVTGEYRLRDFEWAPGQRSGDRWQTCTDCGSLVMRNDWNGLLRRAEESVRERTGEGWSDQVREAMRGLYRQLRKHQA